MSVSSKPFEGAQEASQYKDENDPKVRAGVVSTELDPYGYFGVEHCDPCFFVLTSSTRDATSAGQSEKASEENEQKAGVGVLVSALDILARSQTPLKVHDANNGASVGEDSKKLQDLVPETRTSTSVLLATGFKRGEGSPVKAIVPRWLRTVIVFVGLVVIFVSHAFNMFSYPRYETDEGTYMMSAWAITHGTITPYAYGYGHSPVSWIQIAGWEKLTGGFATFGGAINSGRVLMLFFAVGSAWLVYLIAYHLRLNFVTSLLALVIFAFSPLSITLQREVLLDNFAAFWFLVALYLVLVGRSRLSFTVAAGMCFGFAILSKEVMVILFPVMIYVVWLYTARFQRTFMLVSFCYSVIAVVSTFLLLALLKGELLPYEWHLPWDTHPHLSLIGTFVDQAHRGQIEGSISQSWVIWMGSDPLLIFMGIAAPIFNLLFSWWNRKKLFLALFAIIFWGLLMRGGVVFDFYIIPLIPIVALNVTIAVESIFRFIGRIVRFEKINPVLVLLVLVALVSYDFQQALSPKNIFTLRPTVVQSDALNWIHANVSPRAFIVINSTLYTDLHEPEGQGVGSGTIYPFAHEYLSVATDPDVHDTLLQSNWDRIDYIVANAEMLNIIKTAGGGMDLIKTALEHSMLREHFQTDGEFVDIYQVVHQYPEPDV